MKKRGMGLFIAMGGIALVLIIASIFLIVSGSYTARLVLVNDGFFVGDMVHDSLYANDENAVITSIPAISASQSDILYEKSGKYYVGDDYTPVSLNFPYVINNASAVMFTSSVDKLLTGTFEYVDSYENLYMSGGVTFNSDMERAYREDFILVDTGNGVYMNANKLSVAGALTTAGEIPANSFIRFMEDRIDYYYYEDDALVYSSIAPVSRTASIQISDYSYTYIEFLEKLGLYSERKVREKVSPTPTEAPELEGPEEEAEPTRKVIVVNDSTSGNGEGIGEVVDDGNNNSSSGNGSGTAAEATDPLTGDGDERDEDDDRESITPDPSDRPTRAPKPTREPSIPEPAEDPLPAEDMGPRVTPTPRPTATPLPTPTLVPVIEQTASGGDPMVPEAAAPAAPAAPVAAKDPPVRVPKGPKDTTKRPVYFDEWKKPVVHLGDVTAGVFTIFLDNFNIENAKFLYQRYGVQIYVKEGTDGDGELVYTKSVTGSGPLRLAQPFKPETKYTIKVVLNYINAYGETVAEDIVDYGDIVVETLSRDNLDKLDVVYEKDKKASNSFKLKNFGIGIANKNPNNRFIESVQYLARFEFTATNASDPNDVRVVRLSSSELSRLRKGELFNYESSRVFRSNSTYNFVIRAYDTKGGVLKFENGTSAGADEITGVFKTCTEAPSAVFRVQSNKIYDYSVAIRMSNSGNAAMKRIKYRILDVNGEEVATSVKYITTASGGPITYSSVEGPVTEHYFSDEQVAGIYDASEGASGVDPNRVVEIATSFTDLSDQCVYVLQVLCDYDIYDYDEADYPNGVPDDEKWHEEEVIGETRFTTAAISSLGNLFLENEIPEIEGNLAEGQLYMNLRLGGRTNELLIDLLDDVTVGFYKNEKDEDGKETGRYVLDENAKISYVICDADDDTNYTSIESLLSATRPNDLEKWEAEAQAAGELAYEGVMNTRYTINLNNTREKYRFTEYDENGEEIQYSLDDYYNAARDAQELLNSGDYATDGDDYKELMKIVDRYTEAESTIETEAIGLTRQEAEQARKEAIISSRLSHDIQDPADFYKEGQFTFGSAHVKYTDDSGILQTKYPDDELGQLKEPYSSAVSGSAVSFKYQKELRIVVTGLETNTSYEVRAESKATVGTSGKESPVRTSLSRTSFKTYRKTATVKMDAYYAASDFITLFGVSIDDPDEAISDYPVTLTILNRMGSVMGTRVFNSPNDRFEEIRVNGLAREEEYTIQFIAKGYNRGWTRASSEVNKELYVNDLKETLKLVTHESITADISLISINEAYDLAPEVRVYVGNSDKQKGDITGKFSNQTTGTCTNWLSKGTLSVDGRYYVAGAAQKIGNTAVYLQQAVYAIHAKLGDESYNIIEPGVYPTRNRYTHYQLFEDEACTKPLSDANDPNASVRINAYDASTNYGLSRNYWTSNYIRLNKYLTGEVTVYLKATPLNLDNPLGGKSTSNSGVYMFSGLSFHKFGDKA